MTEEFPDPTPAAPLQELTAESCARLLAATQFGRLAVVDQGRPAIVVLNHTVDGSDVVFRTGDDALIARLTADGRAVHAAYEVDSAFPADRSGWSVIAFGVLTRESDPLLQRTARDRIAPWADGQRDAVMRLEISRLTGRQVGPL